MSRTGRGQFTLEMAREEPAEPAGGGVQTFANVCEPAEAQTCRDSPGVPVWWNRIPFATDEQDRTVGPNGPIASTRPTWREHLGLGKDEELPPVVALVAPSKARRGGE